jgi:hypothetical protein
MRKADFAHYLTKTILDFRAVLLYHYFAVLTNVMKVSVTTILYIHCLFILDTPTCLADVPLALLQIQI